MTRIVMRGPILALGLTVLAVAPSAAEDASVVQEVLGILRERGLVDQEEYERLALQNASYERRQSQTLLSRIQWSGDLRVRLEDFWYDDDDLGSDQPDRDRFRYRLRVGARVPIHELVEAGFRLASFLWKNGKDYLLWDPDINPGARRDPARARADGGVDALREHRLLRARREHVREGPVRARRAGRRRRRARRVGEHRCARQLVRVALAGRGLLRARRGRHGGSTASAGNLPGGLTDGSSFGAGELAAYVRWLGIRDWPILAFGHFARNFDAQEASADDEDTGWGGGLEIGDKKRFVMLGAGYYWLEANFWPSQFIDSDVTDGITNRKAWAFYATRQIFTNTDLTLELFRSFEIEDDRPAFDDSLRNAERYRLRSDIQVRF